MRSIRFLFLVLIIAGVLTSCGQTSTSPTLTPTPILSSQAKAYLTAALDIMQQHSINRKNINWTTVRQQAFAVAAGAKTAADTYAAIQHALTELGDHHSFFVKPEPANLLAAAPLTPDQEPHGRLLTHRIGYIELPHLEASQQAAQQYVMLAQDAIRTVDQAGTCGWIVDLRKNVGGDMWPMLAGVGPILGEGVAGSFVYPDGVKHAWGYYHGQAQLAGATQIGAESPYHLKHPLPPVAVLTSPITASSGEAITVAFRGRPHTRSFGGPTYGIPTDTDDFRLRDGALLVLTVAVSADRTGQTYDNAIAPDQPVPVDLSQIGTTADRGVQATTTWLHDQEGC
jgi:C-terminal processing protease CtpA/Prc